MSTKQYYVALFYKQAPRRGPAGGIIGGCGGKAPAYIMKKKPQKKARIRKASTYKETNSQNKQRKRNL